MTHFLYEVTTWPHNFYDIITCAVYTNAPLVKKMPANFVAVFARRPIVKICLPAHSADNLRQGSYWRFHETLNASLHYLVKYNFRKLHRPKQGNSKLKACVLKKMWSRKMSWYFKAAWRTTNLSFRPNALNLSSTSWCCILQHNLSFRCLKRRLLIC